MIKLNNKNITYVALADSNNSLKAPKEIWYADSSNSVKLVYRRKDALIEGEDYEKYHWLEGDDSAYIQGISYDLWNNHFNTRIGKNERSQYFHYYVQSTATNFQVRVDTNVSIPYLATIFRNAENGIHIADISPYSSMPNVVDFDFYIDDSTFYCNRDGVIYTNSGTNIAIESNWTSIQPTIKSAKISYIREVLPNNTYRSNLIPCKLLKPVPKWLDANGIRRQVGECGMIDLVSGKFYGNVNSVGTFTVENYYERKEWLVGDGTAYIRTNHTLNEDLDWEVKVANFTDYKCIFWQREGEVTDNLNTVLVKAVNYYPGLRVGNKSSEVRINPFSDTEINVSTSGDIITINGQTYQITKGTSTVYGNFALFYTAFYNDSTSQDVCCAYFRFLDSNRNYIQNLIPCTLTMDLPASMDANNIARTKGTSGMWDLVSDKFYGNVANSGTFKAVNLAEGVDYEVHQWLVIQYSESEQATLPIQSNGFNYKYKFYSFGNIGGILTTNNNYIYFSNVGSNGIWGNSERNIVYIGKFYELNKEISINCDANGITMDGELMPNYGSSPYFDNLKIYCFGSTTAKYALSSITVDGIERYIPVKLLKSITSKYDANGIARQAGECGMYDTVNDLFYGNVASSGTFSVSDDS